MAPGGVGRSTAIIAAAYLLYKYIWTSVYCTVLPTLFNSDPVPYKSLPLRELRTFGAPPGDVNRDPRIIEQPSWSTNYIEQPYGCRMHQLTEFEISFHSQRNSMNILPPGLEGPLKQFISGSHPMAKDRDWMKFDRTKLFTNVFIWSDKTGTVRISRACGLEFAFISGVDASWL